MDRAALKEFVGTALASSTANLRATDAHVALFAMIDEMAMGADIAPRLVELTESRATIPSDAGAILWSRTAGVVLTIAANTIPPAQKVELRTRQLGTIRVEPGTGVSLSVTDGSGADIGEVDQRILMHFSDNEFDLTGGGVAPVVPNRPPTAVSGVITFDVEAGP